MSNFIYPNWSAPTNIGALVTTRVGGVSDVPFDSFNVAMHVGDNEQAVIENRRLLPNTNIQWLEQVHSAHVTPLLASSELLIKADASYTSIPNVVCAVLTADCLPILLCDKQGTQVAAVHAGWRGLANGIVENTINELAANHEDIIAWLGPAISAEAFEVGEDVREVFLKYANAFKQGQKKHKFFADIYQIARDKLAEVGVTEIFGGELCTYSDEERFYSYRRDGKTGRMASLIWLKEHNI